MVMIFVTLYVVVIVNCYRIHVVLEIKLSFLPRKLQHNSVANDLFDFVMNFSTNMTIRNLSLHFCSFSNSENKFKEIH
jgi:hypothetical protein